MTVVGAFYGAGDPIVAAGKYLLHLQINTIDRLNLSTASWTVTATGKSYTATADASGRADILVDSGYTYTVEMTHDGEYYNDGAQTVIATSRGSGWVYFDLFRYPDISTVVRCETGVSGCVVTGVSSDSETMTVTADTTGRADFNGLPSGSTWTFTANGFSKTVTVEHLLTEVRLYWIVGVKWAISSSSPDDCEYTDDAVGVTPAASHSLGGWGTHDLYKDIKPMVRTSAGVWKALNKTDLTKCTDGTASGIATVGNDAFVEFPTFWMSMTDDGTYQYLRYASMKVDDTYSKCASLWNGEDVGMFHLGIFHAYNSSSMCYSVSGQSPTVSVSTANFTKYCQARGTGFDKEMWSHRNYVNGLIILAFRTRNLQTALASGYVGGSAKQTESMTTFDNSWGLAGSSGATTTQMAVFWLVNWWGNIYEFVGGAKTDSSCRLQTLDNGEPDNTDGTDYVTHDTSPTSSRGGYVSQMDCGSTEIGFFPKVCSGSSTTFWCDYGYVNASFFPYCGGAWNDGGNAGPFLAYFNRSSSYTSSSVGSRLSYRAGRTA